MIGMPEKRARSNACRNCRIRKRRCLPTASDVNGSCQLCKQQSIPCSLTRRSGQNRPIAPVDDQLSPASTSSATASHIFPGDPLQLLPPRPVLDELIELYFQLIHDGPHTLFHKPTFLSRLQENMVPNFLILAVISLSTRFSTNEYFRNDARPFALAYAKAAIELLEKEMIRPSLEPVQGYILVSQHLGGEGDVRAKHICTGLACLHCQSLRLWDTSGMTILKQEVRRRTYLSVIITGKWTTADMSIAPVTSDFPPENLQLLDEEDFLALRERPARHGIWSQMAKTIDIFRENLDIIIMLGSGETLTSQINKVTHLAKLLDKWEQELPARLKYNPENLTYFQEIGFGKTFLAMHIGYQHYRQLLYFPFLDPRNENSLASSECKKHAMMVSEIVSQGGKLVYYIIGHILVVSSSVHLHTLLLGGGDVDRARSYLLSNFEILMKLKRYWPVIDAAVGRLRSFQNHCRVSSLDSFVLDDWMWKFLMAQSAVLDEPRSAKHASPRGPFISGTEMSNDVLVDTALSWLLD
ncbi:hypothetical protein L207DRAFT_627652 [Hyaloscypha variabilis F]|uniref:Zn(2)-C6 fungal-type domain-containing protein n=1 Tax=Hyaloscypha variabilis (strain UAMH 11265 / GT02V1 / F) TaxID=1149755 RepID=A0A2J6SE42_HYAVF|nr:hypothetical protein L207DRAFT_627652 [Hyaloscypha variabilis F]